MLKIILIAVLALIALLAMVTGILLCVAVVGVRSVSPKRVGAADSWMWRKYADIINAELDWFDAQAPERVSITSFDGLKLTGLYLPAENARGTMLLMHGFHSSAYRDFSCAFRLYHSLGYNILTVYQRAHGESEGKFITYGVKERFDCLEWCRYLNRRSGPEPDVFLSGISMGSSTVLMATGLELPENVRGVIADCGFTSPWDEFAYIMKKRMHLPLVHPLLDIVSAASKLIAGFGFRDYSVPRAMEKNRLPVLFVHGTADTFVPPEMTLENYAACHAPKELIMVEGAHHGESFLIETDRYVSAVKAFLSRWGTCGKDAKMP